MLSLPSKPWKRVRLETVAERHYRIVFLTEFADETAFSEALEQDIRPCLGRRDELGAPDWASRSVELRTPDLPTFKRNLVFACVMVELE